MIWKLKDRQNYTFYVVQLYSFEIGSGRINKEKKLMEFIKYYYSIFSIDVTSRLNFAIQKSVISLGSKRHTWSLHERDEMHLKRSKTFLVVSLINFVVTGQSGRVRSRTLRTRNHRLRWYFAYRQGTMENHGICRLRGPYGISLRYVRSPRPHRKEKASKQITIPYFEVEFWILLNSTYLLSKTHKDPTLYREMFRTAKGKW